MLTAIKETLKSYLWWGRRSVDLCCLLEKADLQSCWVCHFLLFCLFYFLPYNFIYFPAGIFHWVANDYQLNNYTLVFLFFLFCRALAHGLYPSSATVFPVKLNQGHPEVLHQAWYLKSGPRLTSLAESNMWVVSWLGVNCRPHVLGRAPSCPVVKISPISWVFVLKCLVLYSGITKTIWKWDNLWASRSCGCVNAECCVESRQCRKVHKNGSGVELEMLKHKWWLCLWLTCLSPQFLCEMGFLICIAE